MNKTGRSSDLRAPEDVWIVAESARLHALKWDSAGDSTIVFVHGGRLTAHSWRKICAALRDSYQCVAIELRGHGDSSWSSTGQYALADYAGDIGTVVDHLGLGSFVLVGGSLGGLAAMSYASRHGDRVTSLVAIDVSPCVSTSPGAAAIKTFADDSAALGSIEEFVDHAAQFNPRRSRDDLARALKHNLRQRSDGSWTWKYDPMQFDPPRFAKRQTERQRLCGQVALLGCPMLLIRGADSDVLSASQAEHLVDQIPSCSLVTLAGAGHNVHGDQPDALVGVLREYFVSLTLERTARSPIAGVTLSEPGCEDNVAQAKAR